MPSVGARTTPPPVAASHTSTQQWQSFEIKMRHRRAARCVLRAEVALEAGFEEDARAAVDEAQRLNSQTPDLETIRADVADRLARSAMERRAQQRRQAARVAAAAALILAVGLGAFWATRAAVGPTAAPQAARTQPRPAAVASPTPAPEIPASPAPAATTGAEPEQTTDVALAPLRAVPEPMAPEPRLEERTASAAPAGPAADRTADLEATEAPPLPKVEPAVLRVPPAPPLADTRTPAAAIPEATVPIGPLVDTLPAADVPSPADAPAPAPAPAAAAPAAPVAAAPVAEEPRVRAALARYESAYSGLDASAAQAVWPGVDVRSLSRAFDGLESQRVSLGRCAVAVQGTTARADCAGRVTWTPKVGGGAQSQARQWRFELGSANGGWQITRAEVR